MKINYLTWGLCLLTLTGSAQAPLRTFSLQEVTLSPGLFKNAQLTDQHYIEALEPDKLLAPYLREAGLPPKAKPYDNWESTGLDGHIGGHYVSALSLLYASTGDPLALKRLHYMLDELKKVQDANGNGYIGGIPGSSQLWKAIKAGHVQAIRERWVPFYNIHKIYAGLRDAYLVAGQSKALPMLVKFSDWVVDICNSLTDAQMETMLQTEHGGMNEVLADVYQITGDKKYLAAARKFSQKAILLPLENQQDQLTGLHANTQIPKVIGFKRIADTDHDSLYNNAARFFWQTVVTNRSMAIGGNSVGEHFNPTNDFTKMMTDVAGPETCNTYNMLKLTKALYLTDGLQAYMDFYEKALYNHILASQLPGTGGFVYHTPMRPGHYRVYSQPATAMWCCVGTGMENHVKYNEMIYAQQGNDLYVNLFIPSTLHSKSNWQITQQTGFPETDSTSIFITKADKGDIYVRYPEWVQSGLLTIKLNNKSYPVQKTNTGYVKISNNWKKGDRITVTLPMHTALQQLPDKSNYYAILYGPLVLAAQTGNQDMTGLMADTGRFAHVPMGKEYPVAAMPVLLSKDQLTEKIQQHQTKSLTFSMKGLVSPAQYDSLVLVPFYKLHAVRYQLYWKIKED
ncbi:glycoside hydrolase family 127 protein [Chitinophaga sp. Cy-1792]|uniref:glycoside hydrolase family 127 protein n=1 Tax=Chitinophaga sp. Cy-1792 TaxID=2608339 RepID=UPI0014239F86|nr:glycoside hydrolase family 127 protein [Chitinophaga sp. Cy-1792]NIG55918.1 glycosyl hydrolase [Chitinophaga sp. Cy-1792]